MGRRRTRLFKSERREKLRRRDSGETCQIFGNKPEDTMSANVRRLYKIIRELIPLKADTIKIADRRVIREAADQLMEEVVQMAGVVKELRHTISGKDAEIKEARESAVKTVLLVGEDATNGSVAEL
ncbi:uncharacterized protein LOC108733273 isoform X2 [Agrilus planipennis]|uniref:Uncharacterized protein LOC108733273 isoform X2 n=1 Tax=Agrilus planipennis TaxID=224129 RepID=A0A1W4WIM7_AGRPL|nr:uncharacterized protein LOC108733273 isoform X2 [Agrilus planipennis]